MNKPNSALQKRGWVKRHRANLPKVHKEVCKSLLLLKHKLWEGGDSESFAWWVSGVLGVIPANLATLASHQVYLKQGSEELGNKNLFCQRSADFVIGHICHSRKGHYKIMAYEKPSMTPTGYIHLFDLTPKELETRLNIAIKKQGINKQKALLLDWAKTTPELPTKSATDPQDPLFDKAEALKHTIKHALREMITGIGYQITPEDEKRLNKFADTFFTPESAQIITDRLTQLSEAYKKELLQHEKYYAEQLKSLPEGKVPLKNSLGPYLQEEMLKLFKGIIGDFGTVPLRGLLGKDQNAGTAQCDPDEVYRQQQDIYRRRKFVQEICARQKHKDTALQECQQRYPGMSLVQMESDYRNAHENVPKALEEAAKLLDLRGLAYARKLYNLGKNTAEINAVWDEYLKKYYPLTEPVTPYNFPATPPVTLPKS